MSLDTCLKKGGKVKKICPGCGQERDAEKDFSWKYKDRGIRNTRCRICQSQVSKQHYKNNKQSYVNRTRVLEFDHVRGSKIDAVTRLLSKRLCWPSIEAEIAKCEVRCANCHRIKTSEQGGFWRNFFDL